MNLAQNTASPLLGFIAAPIALIFNPLIGTNLLMVLAMPISATAAFVVLRKWQVWVVAAAIGGLIYGFSPFMVAQGSDHLFFTFAPLPPFIALTIVSILQRKGSPWRLGIQLGLLVAAQYLISPEVLASVAILTLVALMCIAIRHPANVRRLMRTVSGPFAIGFTVSVVLLAYPVWMLLAGPQHFTGRTWPTLNPFHNDLLSFVVPGPLQQVSLGMRSLGDRLIGGSNPWEAGAYIGVPLLILAGILSWRSRRSPRMQLAVLLFFVAALLSLGPYLVVDGLMTQIRLPFLVLDHLPLLDDLVPSRFSLEVGACFAAAIAFGLDDMRRAPTKADPRADRRLRATLGGSAVVAGVTLALLVATELPHWPYGARKEVAALPGHIRQAVPTGDPVAITYPYPSIFGTQPMVWQAEDGYRFRMLGGYAYRPGPGDQPTLAPPLMKPSGLQRFLIVEAGSGFLGPLMPLNQALVSTTRTTLSRYGIGLVIVDRSEPGSGPVVQLFNEALGPPKATSGQFSLWTSWHHSIDRRRQ